MIMKTSSTKTLTLAAAVLLGISACASRNTVPQSAAPSVAPQTTKIVVTPPATTRPILADISTTQPSEPALPPGHPQLSSSNTGGLPAGHPAVGGKTKPAGPLPPGAQLPAGHPAIAESNAPASTQPAKLGSLVIQTKQGTAGGPAIGSDPATIEFFADGKSVGKFDTKLAADGTLRLNGVPVDQPLQPLVTITHAGVDYTGSADVMDAEHATQKVEVSLYETTDKAPAWSLKMRHVIVHSTPDAVEVMEMLAVDVPGDRAWLGTADGKGGHTSFTIALPTGAKDVKLLNGFHDCCTTSDGGKLTNNMAIVPGATQYALSYVVPATAGKADLTITAPAAVGHMMVFVPEDSTTVAVNGLNSIGAMPMDNGEQMRCYMATSLTPQQKVNVTISDLSKGTPPKVSDAAPAAAGGGAMPAETPAKAGVGLPQRLAVGGAAVILVVGALVMFVVKSPKAAK
jgi:hypothetical protein